MLVLYLILIMFHDFKFCVVAKHFSFHYFQIFATIVDILGEPKKIVQIFLISINVFRFFALDIFYN